MDTKKIDGLVEGLVTQQYSAEAQPLAEGLQAFVTEGTAVEMTLEESVYLAEKLETLKDQIAVIEESVILTEGQAGGFVSWLKRVYAGKDDSAIDDFKEDIKEAKTADDLDDVITTIDNFITEVKKVQQNKFTWKTFFKYWVVGNATAGLSHVAAIASTVYQSNIKKQLAKYRSELEKLLKEARDRKSVV